MDLLGEVLYGHDIHLPCPQCRSSRMDLAYEKSKPTTLRARLTPVNRTSFRHLAKVYDNIGMKHPRILTKRWTDSRHGNFYSIRNRTSHMHGNTIKATASSGQFIDHDRFQTLPAYQSGQPYAEPPHRARPADAKQGIGERSRSVCFHREGVLLAESSDPGTLLITEGAFIAQKAGVFKYAPRPVDTRTARRVEGGTLDFYFSKLSSLCNR